MRNRGLLLVVPVAMVAMLSASGAQAAPGGTLTVPAQVQASAGANPVLKLTFSYPEATPFCTVGVDFTWDGAPWLSEFPNKSGQLCVAAGDNATAPSGHGAAGAHQVCGSAGAQFRDCKSVAVVVAAGTAKPTPGIAGAASPGTVAAAPGTAPTTNPVSTQQPAVPVPAAIASRLPRETATGLVLLAVGLAGLLVVGGRRLLLRLRRRRSGALPSPGPRR